MNIFLRSPDQIWIAFLHPYVEQPQVAESPRMVLLNRPTDSFHSRYEIIANWFGLCSRWHVESCGSTGLDTSNENVSSTYMIDTRNRCVVKPPRNCKYVALSYCWGHSRKPKPLLLRNQSDAIDYTETGSLCDDNEHIPTTIRDAIVVAEKLGFDFIWIDSLCIQQDNEEHKSVQIRHMDQIYRSASLTIVAAAGDNAWSGLPGSRPDNRPSYQTVSEISGIELVTASETLGRTLVASGWRKRAWTLQEEYLSDRLLIFTPFEIFWRCNRATWREECRQEWPLLASNSENQDDVILPRHDEPLEYQYHFIVTQASSRQISFESDRLAAVEGVLSHLSTRFNCGFHLGLPRNLFNYALLWERKLDKDDGGGDSFHLNSYFPTWSWLGWNVQIRWPIRHEMSKDDLLCDHPAWFSLREEGGWELLTSSPSASETSARYRESLSRWSQQDEEVLRADIFSKLSDSGADPRHAIVGWAKVFHLKDDDAKVPATLMALISSSEKIDERNRAKDATNTHSPSASYQFQAIQVVAGDLFTYILYIRTVNGISTRMFSTFELTFNVAYDSLHSRLEMESVDKDSYKWQLVVLV